VTWQHRPALEWQHDVEIARGDHRSPARGTRDSAELLFNDAIRSIAQDAGRPDVIFEDAA
jgi:hypothetical protein